MQIAAYLEHVSHKLKQNLLVLVSVLLLYSFWYLFDIGKYLSFSYLHISLGHIGYLGLSLIPAFLVLEKESLQKIWIFFAGIALLDLIPMVYITNNKSPYEYSFLNSSTIVIVFALFFLAILYGLSKSRNNKNLIVKAKDLLIVVSSSVISIAAYHGINLLNRDIPRRTVNYD